MKSLHKRILALLLSVLMVISVGILPVAADQTAEAPVAEGEIVDAPVASEKAKALVAKWSAFGIIPAETDPLATATRGGVAKMLADLLGVSGVTAASEITDVPAEIAGAARAARDLGFFEVVDGKFRPDDSASISDVLKALAVLVGYPADLVAGNGGSLALQARLCKGIDGNHASACNWETILRLMDNVADEEIVRVIGMYNGKAFSAEVAEDTTILNEYLKLYEVEGKITATSATAINGEQPVKNGVRIGGEKYIDKASLANKLGYAISGWYKAGKNDKTIIYAGPQYKDQESWVLSDRDILPTSTTATISYVDKETDEIEEINIASDAIFVYNGSYLATPEDADVNPVTGQLEIVDNNGDNRADVVNITSAVAYVVADVNGPARYISDKYKEEKAMKFSEDCELTVVKRGEVISMDEIKKNNVVYVGMSKDGTTAVLDVYAVQQRGMLTGFDDEYLYIDGNPYLIGKDNYDDMIALELGAKFTFYLGMNEAVIGAAPQVSNDTYGYLTNVGYVTEGLDEYGLFRIFDATYGFMNYRTADKVFVNGEITPLLTAIGRVKDGAGAVVPQAVMFRTNEDGELTHLQIATTTPEALIYDEAVFSKDLVMNNTAVKLPGLVESKVMFTGDMTTIQVPKDEHGKVIEDGIKIVPFAEMNVNDVAYSGICYDVTADRNVKLFIWEIVGAASATLKNEELFIVNRVYRKVNKEGRPATFVDGMYKGAALSLEVKKDGFKGTDPEAIQSGDVIWVSIDAMNRLVAAKHAFTLQKRNVAPLYRTVYGMTAYNADTAIAPTLDIITSTNIMSKHQSLAHCKATRVMGNNLLVQFSPDIPASLIGPTGAGACYVYDEETKTVRAGTLAADVRPYDENQTLLVWMYTGRYTQVIVMNHKPLEVYTSWLYEPFTTATIGANGMPGHSGSSETWSSEAPLNYEIVDMADHGNVLKITSGSDVNAAMQKIVTATSKEASTSKMEYSFCFRLNVSSYTGAAGAQLQLGTSANSIAIDNGMLKLVDGAGNETNIGAYTPGDWHEIRIDVRRENGVTKTSVYIDGLTKINNKETVDGNWKYNSKARGYFNIQNVGESDEANLSYTIYLDDLYIDWPLNPDEVNADGEAPRFAEPGRIITEDFSSSVISDGTVKCTDTQLAWNKGKDHTMSIEDGDSSTTGKVLKISQRGGSWPASAFVTEYLNSSDSRDEYEVEYRFKLSNHVAGSTTIGRPIMMSIGNNVVHILGQKAYLHNVANSAAANSMTLLGNCAYDQWHVVKIRVYKDNGKTLTDITFDGVSQNGLEMNIAGVTTPKPQGQGFIFNLNSVSGNTYDTSDAWYVGYDFYLDYIQLSYSGVYPQ